MAAKTTEQQPEAAQTVYSIDRLRQDCTILFGVSPSTFDGAVYGMRGEYTVEDMRQAIDAWKKKPVWKGAKK